MFWSGEGGNVRKESAEAVGKGWCEMRGFLFDTNHRRGAPRRELSRSATQWEAFLIFLKF